MPNLLSLLNENIRRLARREIRGQTQKTRRLIIRQEARGRCPASICQPS